ncbi:hypothetical protein Pelo_4800 [Pelomyxa schiedti]|nr:hypothetical protein Pelo_4800 [Pelomyxa schiedti]
MSGNEGERLNLWCQGLKLQPPELSQQLFDKLISLGFDSLAVLSGLPSDDQADLLAESGLKFGNKKKLLDALRALSVPVTVPSLTSSTSQSVSVEATNTPVTAAALDGAPAATLLDSEKAAICEFIEAGYSSEKIIQLLCSSSPGKVYLVHRHISTLVRPPRPPPEGCKLLTIKRAGPTLPLFQYPSKKYYTKKYYTFLVIGETGSGKTTLLDAFTNFLAAPPPLRDDDIQLLPTCGVQEVPQTPPSVTTTTTSVLKPPTLGAPTSSPL